MGYKIIGIHGLFNKPSKTEIEKGWKQAIIEGLEKNVESDLKDLNFEIVYWADLAYDEFDHEAELYRPAKDGDLIEYKNGWIDSIRTSAQAVLDDTLDISKQLFHIDYVADSILEKKAKDLHTYYSNNEFKNKTREILIKTILDNKDRKIILVAHSMGSIIAYDSLVRLSQENSDIEIDYFITIGSPLGLPHVKYKINKEFNSLSTPENVQNWKNFADKRDKVALDTHLSDDYKANIKNIKVIDDLVLNDWYGNPHKSYGYLRTPEFSRHIVSIIENLYSINNSPYGLYYHI